MRRSSLTTTKMPDNGWQTIRQVSPYLWPQGEAWIKRRVVLALLALFLSGNDASV